MFLNKFSITVLFFITFLIFSPPVGGAGVVYCGAIEEKTTCPPVERGKKTKKNKKKRYKQKLRQAKHNNDIVPSLYITFAAMALFPLFVIIGFFLIGFGFPLLIYFISGLVLIAIGDGATMIAGSIAGANKTYSTQVLSFALWLLFGINMVGGIVFLIMSLSFFLGWYNLFLLAFGLFFLAIIMMVWALTIRKQNKAFRNNTDNVQ